MIQRTPSTYRLLLLLGLMAALTFPATAQAWWNSDWPLRKKIMIDTIATGVAITEPIGTAPVLVRLHDGNFPFTAAKPDGSDLRFIAADDQTPLAFHLEKFDSLLNEAFVWVKLPDLKPGVQASFWLYYGNTGKAAERVDDVKGTYDKDTVLVYHFAEKGTAANDASASGLNAQNPGTPAEGAMIGTGLRLDEHGTVTIPASPALAWADGATFTWSAWVKFGAPQPNGVLFSRADGVNGFVIGVNNNFPFIEVTNAGGSQRSQPAQPAVAPGWHHLAVVADGAKLAVSVDGEAYSSLNVRLPAISGPALLGSGRGSGVADASLGGGNFVGEIDELEIAKVARPAGFIKFAALEQGGDKSAAMLKFGEEERPKDWFAFLKGGYVGVIIGSLTFDGWVVIGILAVMSLISWFVMIGKGRFLGRVGRGNELFLNEWRHVASDLSVLDQGDSEQAKSFGGRVDAKGQRVMRDSPIFHIYHIGVEELHHRLAADKSDGAKKALSSRSIQAIRASLDGRLVRETHRLNRSMVLLTIAISGGPFLGLLGTVVGVMITFASVAQAGEVNVNAIAPGIAAALAATVAGLAVAIPALFGYNYLLTRIKAEGSNMHVFVDEFVTKLAEFYRGRAD